MITVKWDNPEKTIIRLDYSDPVESWTEYQDAMDQGFNLARQMPYNVHQIHMAGKTKMPSGNAFGQLRQAMSRQPKNMGLIISVVNDNFAIDVMRLTTALLVGRNLRLVVDLEQAYQLIAEYQQKKL